MKKDNQFVLILIGIIIFTFILVYFLFAITPKNIYELTAGESAHDFCGVKCGEQDVYGSNKSLNYSFIRCECVEGFKHSQSYTNAGKSYPITKEIYFDLKTGNELNKTEILERIDNSS